MASIAASSTSLQARSRQLILTCTDGTKFEYDSQAIAVNQVKCFSQGRSNLSFTLRPYSTRLRVSCAAKSETVDKVCAIVRKQLSLDETKKVAAESKFVDLGADSLDTVEIVMVLEEEFGIEMAEERAQTIATVEQAAELIEELLMEKAK